MTEREIWAYQNIANAVIVDAVAEWRRIIRRDPNSGRLDELRQFFQSEWCALLCGQVDPALILERLEREARGSTRLETPAAPEEGAGE